MEDIQIGRYLDISRDRVFKNVFGKRANKDLLIALLNLVLDGIDIVDLEYLSGEFQGFDIGSRQSRMDLRVKTIAGTEVIVEVQVRDQHDFKDRAVYYAALPILEDVEAGKGRYVLRDRIIVSFLHFQLEHSEDAHWADECRSVYSLREKVTGEKLSDAINLVFVELSRFKKPLESLDNDLERFYFCLQHMGELPEIPDGMAGSELMRRLFDVTEVESLPKEEKRKYYSYMTTERDIRNQIDFAVEQGEARGRAEGRAEGQAEGEAKERLKVARSFKSLGVSADIISKATGLSEAEIAAL